MTIAYAELSWAVGYRFGDDGSAWSRRNLGGWGLVEEWRRLSPGVMPKGYRIVNIGGVGTRLLHCLILEAFCGPRPEGMEGCHNDRDPSNNRLDNLRWDTPKNNVSDAIRHGTATIGFNNGAAKLSPEDMPLIAILRGEGVSFADIARVFEVHPSTIRRAYTGKTYSRKLG